MATLSSTNGYDSRDPNGSITIRWDVMSWTPDGYVAVVNITNYQHYRTVYAPGWKLRWTWPRKEVIWRIHGGHTTDQGDCSRFKGDIPLSCAKTPTIINLTAGAAHNHQINGCCRGGILLSRYQDLKKSTVNFQIDVGAAGTTNATVRLPTNYTFLAPRGGYSCSAARKVPNTRFTTPDGKRVIQALMTWQVVCTYSAFLANKVPPCCVSLSSNQEMRTTCPTCSCSCRNESRSCATGRSKLISTVKCTDHMCPVNINWHMMSKVKENERRTLVSISNLNYRMNYSDWITLVEHPAVRNLTNVIHANHRLLPSTYSEMEVLWGIKNYNQVIAPFGTRGSIVNLILVFNDTVKDDKVGEWNSPKAIFFNGDRCVIHPQTHQL